MVLPELVRILFVYASYHGRTSFGLNRRDPKQVRTSYNVGTAQVRRWLKCTYKMLCLKAGWYLKQRNEKQRNEKVGQIPIAL